MCVWLTLFCLCCCRDKLWGVCVSVLALLPRVLRLMLQSLRVNRAAPEELPVVGQLLRLLLQHAPLRTHMLTNAILVQQIIKNITVRSMCCQCEKGFLGKARRAPGRPGILCEAHSYSVAPCGDFPWLLPSSTGH